MRSLAMSTAICAALVGSYVAPAAARPNVTLAVDGACPRPEQLAATLAPWVEIATEGGEWTIAVVGDAATAELSVRDANGAVALSRRVTSPDCTARAEAFAVMIHAHFVELRLLPLPSKEPVAPAEPAPAVVAESPVAASTALPREDRPAASARPARAPIATLAVTGGVGVSGKDATISGVGQLEGAWFRGRWLAFATLTVDSPTTIEATMDRIEQWRGGARVGLGHRLDVGPLWVQPALGAGVVAWRVDALDLPAGSPRWSLQPIAVATAAVGIPIGRQLALRIEPRGVVYLVRDRYVIDPQGVIARSPRAGFELAAGLEFGWFR